jgi:hypothetical protein
MSRHPQAKGRRSRRAHPSSVHPGCVWRGFQMAPMRGCEARFPALRCSRAGSTLRADARKITLLASPWTPSESPSTHTKSVRFEPFDCLPRQALRINFEPKARSRETLTLANHSPNPTVTPDLFRGPPGGMRAVINLALFRRLSGPRVATKVTGSAISPHIPRTARQRNRPWSSGAAHPRPQCRAPDGSGSP